MPRSTLNSITASLDWDDFMASSSGETNTSLVTTTSSASQPIFSISSETLSQAFSQALGQSLPQILAVFQANRATSASTSSAVQSPGDGAHASNVASSSIPSSSTTSGNVVVPSFISTYSTVGNPVFTALGQPPLMAISTPSSFVSPAWPAPGNSTFVPSVGKAFVVGPGYAPIPAKLVAKITSGVFVELADLLAENLRAQESEPHTYLDGKLVVSPARKRVVEITDILTWVQAFTIYAWVFCNAHPNRWQDLTRYKLLIMQTARQFPGPAWQTYDVAFRKDAAASGLVDWSKMNLDLYNFHTRTSGVPQSSPSLLGTQSAFPLPPSSSAPTSPSLPVPRSSTSVYYCRSWNNGACRWTLGQCRFRHVCERCDGDHPLVSCPFRANKGMQRSRSLTPSGSKRSRR